MIAKPIRSLPDNVNFAIKLCQELGFNLHNIAGLDILDCKDPKLLYAILWKCLRYHSLMIVSKALGIKQTASHKDIDESKIIEWANAKCEENGCTGELETFKDKWNSKPRMAKITKKIKEDSDKDKILTFELSAVKYEKNTDVISKPFYERKYTEKINLYGSSFNKEIDEILAEIKTEPSAQANTSKTEKTEIIKTEGSGINTVEF